MADTSVNHSEAANRYAVALLELAEDAKALKTVEKDVKTLRGMITSSADLRRFIDSPVFASDEKATAIAALCSKAKLGKLTSQFAGLVAKNRRANELPEMIARFEALLAERRGSASAIVTSAQKLTAAQLTALKANLKKSIGSNVDIVTQVDPDLLGGFVVKVGSRLYDSSLKTKLEGLKLAMKEV